MLKTDGFFVQRLQDCFYILLSTNGLSKGEVIYDQVFFIQSDKTGEIGLE